MSIGVPLKLLHEAENHVVTIELKTGEMFRGYLKDVEDTMNVRMDDVYVVSKEGKQYHLDQIYLRGSQIRFFVIPDMLKHAPMLKKVKNQTKAAKQSVIMKAKVKSRAVIVPDKNKTSTLNV